MKFKNSKDLVNHVNRDIGSFCNTFLYKRKELVGDKRVGKRGILFTLNPEKERPWAINPGGGTEVQYHLAFYDENNTPYIIYGIGFNAQYVPHHNDLLPEEYIRPFTRAFLKEEGNIRAMLPSYDFVINGYDELKNPKRDDYVLFGKEISVDKIGNGEYELKDNDYQTLLQDLKDQFGAYVMIFEERNRMMETEKNSDMYVDLLKIKPQIILQGPPGTGKTHTAKNIAYNMIYGKAVSANPDTREEQMKELFKSDQFELIQFHPAYSYDDFVRGITVQSNGTSVQYETENKILGDIALKALENYRDSKKEVKELTYEQWVENEFQEFADQLESDMQIDEADGLKLSPSVRIISVDDDAFRYTGRGWKNEFRMKFKDIIILYSLNIKERSEIKNCKEVSPLAKSHATYYKALLNLFYTFMKGTTPPKKEVKKVELMNFVLVVDEINRANLPSVLGELIYALEYRGEAVTGMYDIDGNKKLILPPNLFIIGTMNTADRSVGHIDYAIRRRFAFAEIQPNSDLIQNAKAKRLFESVSGLFEKEFLSSEFDKKDVQVGHSYFMVQSDQELEIRLQFELKPLLQEYVNDGILLENAISKIDALAIGE